MQNKENKVTVQYIDKKDEVAYNYMPYICSRVLELINDLFHYRKICKQNLEEINNNQPTTSEKIKGKIEIELDSINKYEESYGKSLDTTNRKEFLTFFSNNDLILFLETTLYQIIDTYFLITSGRLNTNDNNDKGKDKLEKIKSSISEIVFDLNFFQLTDDKKDLEAFEKDKQIILDELNNIRSGSDLLNWYNDYKSLTARAIVNELCCADFLAYKGDIMLENMPVQTFHSTNVYGAELGFLSSYCTFPMIQPNKLIRLDKDMNIISNLSDQAIDKYHFTVKVFDISVIHNSVQMEIMVTDIETNTSSNHFIELDIQDFLILFTLNNDLEFVKQIINILENLDELLDTPHSSNSTTHLQHQD